jgi:hypothetical protein
MAAPTIFPNLHIGTTAVPPFAQLSGLSAGFDLFTPTQNATYYLIVRGQDAASGAPSNGFVDVLLAYSTGTVVPTVITSTTFVGTPGARTYSNNSGALKIALANGITWYIDMITLKFPA